MHKQLKNSIQKIGCFIFSNSAILVLQTKMNFTMKKHPKNATPLNAAVVCKIYEKVHKQLTTIVTPYQI